MVQLILETEIARHGLTRYLQIVRDPLVLAAWKNSTPILTLLLSSGNRGGKRLFYRYPKKAALSVATTFSDTKALAGNGSAEDIKIVEGSGVLAYDMAVRASLLRTEYPRAFWGKTIAVVFGKMPAR
jgi:hypothetical protein